jgi:hypothetical protein
MMETMETFDGNDGNTMETFDGNDGTDGNSARDELHTITLVVARSIYDGTSIGDSTILSTTTTRTLPTLSNDGNDVRVIRPGESIPLSGRIDDTARITSNVETPPLPSFTHLPAWSWMVGLAIQRVILPIVITGVFCILTLTGWSGGGGTVFVVGGRGITLSIWRCNDKLIAQLINEIPPKSNISFYARTEPKANRCEALPK